MRQKKDLQEVIAEIEEAGVPRPLGVTLSPFEVFRCQVGVGCYSTLKWTWPKFTWRPRRRITPRIEFSLPLYKPLNSMMLRPEIPVKMSILIFQNAY